MRRRLPLLALVLFCCSSLFGQSPNAVVNGQVLDSSGGVVPDASVQVINDATHVIYEGKTNREGIYSIPTLPPGSYHIQVSRVGFKTIVQPDIVLNVQDAKAINFTLPVGAISDTVTVEGGAPLINTESAAVSTVVDRQFVENMPLNGRTLQSLITLTPGVILTPASISSPGQFSVNGQRADANYFMIDGVSATAGVNASILGQSAGGALPALSATGGTNTLISIDAIEEFRIQTSSFSPEFGRTPGAQVSIATRSGANDLHGALFNYFRNEAMDANDWFSDSLGLKKAALRQNDFGGVLGGPIIKNRTFFFLSYEGLRLRLPQTRTDLVPSVSARQQAAPAIQPVLNLYPLPNGPTNPTTLFAPFSSTYSDPSSLDAGSVRIDQTLGSKFSLFGRYNYAPSSGSQRGGAAPAANVLNAGDFQNQTLTVGGTASLSHAIVADIRFNYSRAKATTSSFVDTFGGGVPLRNDQLFPSISAPSGSGFTLALLGGAQMNDGYISSNTQRQVNAIGSVSIQAGPHQMKFGVDYRHLAPSFGPSPYDQIFIFQGLTGPLGAISATPLLALVAAQDAITLSYQNVSSYAQDTWRATPRITVSYGLRWDVNPAPSGQGGKSLLAVQGLDHPSTVSFAPAGTSLYSTAYANLAPRIGFAYQLIQGSGKALVLRAGFGLFYDLGDGNVADASNSFPFLRTTVLSGIKYPLTPAQAAPPAFSLTPSSPQQIQVADPNLSTPRVYQWNIALEQSLGSNQAVSVSYVGAAGRRLLRIENILTGGGPFSALVVTKNTTTSDYDALQVQFRRRFSRGLEALGSYTWSHSIDIGSVDSIGSSSYLFSPSVDRGSSDFDVRHALTGAISYNLPTPASTLMKRVLNGWSIDTIFRTRTGTPVNVTDSNLTLNVTNTYPRPDLIPGIPIYLDDSNVPGGRRINNTKGAGPGCLGPFCPPPTDSNRKPLRQGNLGRNALRGLGAAQVDLALRRQFRLTERFKLQFRAEAFNIFNHPNFGNFISNMSDSRFGLSVAMLGRSLVAPGAFTGGLSPLYQMGGPRSLQLALKVVF